MLQQLIRALAASTASADVYCRDVAELIRPNQAPHRNGGRHRTAAQDRRRAAKRRATRRAKRLGHN